MKRLLDLLESVAKRPQMYFGPVTFRAAQDFLLGLRYGCEFAGIKYSREHYRAAVEDRGWDPCGNVGILRDFERKGLSDEEMARELLAVELGAYRRAREDAK